jgi:hypothetical protein
MKAFGWFLLFAVMSFAAFSFSLASDSTTACFDIAAEGGNVTHIFVDSIFGASASDYSITVDGEPITHLQTDDGPCENIPRDVWFSLQTNQDTAHVASPFRMPVQRTFRCMQRSITNAFPPPCRWCP